MGFGIAFLGYCFLLLHQVGLGVVGVPLLAYGFFLASRLHRYFLGAAVSAVLMLPRAVLILLDIFLPFVGVESKLAETYPWLNLITYLVFLVAWLSMIFWHCTAVKLIAKDNGAEKLEKQAVRRLYISGAVIFLALSLVILQQFITEQAVILITYLAIYVVLITSEKQYADDKQYVIEQNREVAEKRAKDRAKFGDDAGNGMKNKKKKS